IESVPAIRIEDLSWTPHLDRWEIGFEGFITSICPDGLALRVKLFSGDKILVHDTYEVISHEVHRRLALSDPGIDDFRNELLWTPEKPTLIDAEVELLRG